MAEVNKLPEGKTFHENLHKVKNFVNREYGTPVAIIRRGESRFLAVAAETKKKPLPTEIDVPILQGLAAQVRLLPDSLQTLNLANLNTREESSIATTFLGFELRGYLRNNRALWQGASAFLYYTKRPLDVIRQNGRTPHVTIYPGFSYRILNIPGTGLCLAVDIIHVYTDTRTLAQRLETGDDWRELIGRHFVYEFGPQWYFAQFQEVAKHSIKEACFPHPQTGNNTNVFDYTLEKWPNSQLPRLRGLKPSDQTFVYNYPGQSSQFQGAITLARLRYQTDEVGGLHRMAILDPAPRLESIRSVIAAHFDRKTSLGNTSIQFSHEPLAVPKKVFHIPAQLFGNNRKLPSPGNRPREADINQMRQKRAIWLRDEKIGSLTRTGISNQFLLTPLSLANDEALLDRTREDLTEAINQVMPMPYRPTPVIWDDREARTIPQIKKALAEPIRQMEQAGIACALVILPEKWSQAQTGKYRRHIKKLLYQRGIRTKCVQAKKLLSHLEPGDNGYQVIKGKARKYASYLFNTAMDILVTSGFWPWALAEPLNYDLYVGVDVLNNTAGFTFLAANGTICRFQPSTSEQEEKLSAEQMAEILLKNLREIIPRILRQTGKLPCHLVLGRDGRSYDTEIEGLHYTIKKLQEESLLPSGVQVSVVEIHKSNAARLRMFAKLQGGSIVNPMVGSYYAFDDWGVLCTTGYPGLPGGTADPIVVEVVDGDLDIEKVLRDIYWLSILAWTKPDGMQSNPIIIKLADDWLESIAAETSKDEELFDPLES